MKDNKLLDEVYRASQQDSFNLYNIWINQIVFTWRWWLEMALAIIPWIIWIKIRRKKDTIRLLFVGLVVAIICNVLDIVGGSYNLWHYDWKDFPFIPIYLPWDFTLFPVSVMVMLQFWTKINKYIKAIIFSFLCSFVFEPLFSSIGMYHMIHWHYWYSFLIYIPLYLFYDYIYNCKLWQIKI